jgi:hypothetical protein
MDGHDCEIQSSAIRSTSLPADYVELGSAFARVSNAAWASVESADYFTVGYSTARVDQDYWEIEAEDGPEGQQHVYAQIESVMPSVRSAQAIGEFP